MTQIPDSFLDLLQQKKAFANLATVLADGSPQVTPVWFDYSAGAIRFIGRPDCASAWEAASSRSASTVLAGVRPTAST